MKFATVILTAALALAFAQTAASKDIPAPPVPLTIKGVAIGDTRDQGSQIGACDHFLENTCIGNTSFGPAQNAEFMVRYVGGRVNLIYLTFDMRHAPEILAGLTRKFGKPRDCPDRVGEAGCHVFMTPGVNLSVIEDQTRNTALHHDHVGSVTLQRATPADNF